MLAALAILLVCQLIGEAVAHVASVPIPGPVVGMALLFALILVRAPLSSSLGDTADGLLRHLSLLFVPAGVGVVQHLDRLSGDGIRLIVVVVAATAVTLAVTALVFEGLARLMQVNEVPSDRDSPSSP
jgi:putative effector of murein hydrolase LrgA (UPF0299 family)